MIRFVKAKLVTFFFTLKNSILILISNEEKFSF